VIQQDNFIMPISFPIWFEFRSHLNSRRGKSLFDEKTIHSVVWRRNDSFLRKLHEAPLHADSRHSFRGARDL
jgi:hypothetical protein